MQDYHEESRLFFENLCVTYYEKVLRYLYAALGDECAAKDCVQDVFLIACQKSEMLRQHPNPGGFLFQTAKNLVRKTRRESFSRLLKELPAAGDAVETADAQAEIEVMMDRGIDESDYIEAVLSQLTGEKRELYNLYYLNNKTMAEIAALLGKKEAAVRMRYVRLRREISAIVSDVAKKNFDY